VDIFNPAFWTFMAVIAGIYVILSLGLYVQFSMAGLPNFGHVAFMAVAAYTMAILVVRLEMGLPLASALALVAAVVLGLVLGVPALRLRADYLAIATVAGGEMVRYLAMNFPGLTGGPLGSIGLLGPGDIATYNDGWMRMLNRLATEASGLLGWKVPRDLVMMIIVWATAAVLLGIFWKLERSPWGRVLRAIREDETAATAVGKNVLGSSSRPSSWGRSWAASPASSSRCKSACSRRTTTSRP
jgi:branched-chain amino acid transport system permease protein